jgi:hypothetical protein
MTTPVPSRSVPSVAALRASGSARLDGDYRGEERLGVDRWSFAPRWVRCARSE